MQPEIASARERFAAGQDCAEVVVRPEIGRSWHRCRDDYGTDPGQTRAPPADDRCEPSLKASRVLTELGSISAALAASEGIKADIVIIADGSGRVLTTHGDHAARHHAECSNLAAWSSWSERAIGTNGIGTALECSDGIVVRGDEHWCRGPQQWSCAGVAISDPVSASPLAVLAIASHLGELPDQALAWLHKSVRGIERELRRQASRDCADLAAALMAEHRQDCQALVALDAGGGVVAISCRGQARSNRSNLGRAMDFPVLRELVREGVDRARADRSWVGFAEPFIPAIGDVLPLTMRPVVQHNRVIGVLGAFGDHAGERLGHEHSGLDRAEPEPGQRVLAFKGNRQIVLRPEQIIVAEAERNTIWLTTDRGRVRARDRGLDKLLAALAGAGFIRVHRHFIVNARRVSEIEHGFRGQLSLIMDLASGRAGQAGRTVPTVPVSRRRGPAVRRALAL
ncbi:MAG TPA: LytTR family transcriptional regulator DNA-binding domain-containing protein [Streptosporangiaceae bacterium]|nr:LytTR family transcriptional regulator DNA-binding domain-containing protein [Streptosporangiaceae bacterium]